MTPLSLEHPLGFPPRCYETDGEWNGREGRDLKMVGDFEDDKEPLPNSASIITRRMKDIFAVTEIAENYIGYY